VKVDTLEMYEALLRRSLERGVPDAAVADIFDLPVELIKEMSREVKVTRFNTTDKNEYVENLEWETLESVAQMIRTGSPEQAARIATAVFGKQIQAAGRRPSSAATERQSEIMEALAEIREGSSSPMKPGRFVVGNVAVERRAHRVEEDEE
jgi:glutamyl/glutaminyl-tRNA synthetase